MRTEARQRVAGGRATGVRGRPNEPWCSDFASDTAPNSIRWPEARVLPACRMSTADEAGARCVISTRPIMALPLQEGAFDG